MTYYTLTATGRNKAAVEESYEKEGDLGTVALASRASQTTLSFAGKSKPLSATHVLDQLRQVALTKVHVYSIVTYVGNIYLFQ